MRTVLGFCIFCIFLQKFVKVAKNKETYTMVRFSFCKDTLLAAPDMRPVIRFTVLIVAKESLSLRELAPANPVQSFM